MAGTTNRRQALRQRRHARVRRTVSGTAERPRLAVFRSIRHITAQLVDDTVGRTLVAASTVEPTLRSQIGPAGGGNLVGAETVGKLLAVRAREAGITRVVFDRGGFAYHGRVAALADGARKEGLEF